MVAIIFFNGTSEWLILAHGANLVQLAPKTALNGYYTSAPLCQNSQFVLFCVRMPTLCLLRFPIYDTLLYSSGCLGIEPIALSNSIWNVLLV